jgi:hypothetical protein
MWACNPHKRYTRARACQVEQKLVPTSAYT